MSKNNDEKVKTILESNEIPQELEPENIKAMLDRKKIRNNKGKKAKSGFRSSFCKARAEAYG
jgi:hypothetical protein